MVFFVSFQPKFSARIDILLGGVIISRIGLGVALCDLNLEPSEGNNDNETGDIKKRSR